MLKIVIIGYGEMYANIIQGCLNSNVKIVGVFYDELIKLSPLKLFLKNIFYYYGSLLLRHIMQCYFYYLINLPKKL